MADATQLAESDLNDVLRLVAAEVGGYTELALIVRPWLSEAPERARQGLLGLLARDDAGAVLTADDLVRLLRGTRERGHDLLGAWLNAVTGPPPDRKGALLAEAARLADRQRRVHDELQRIQLAEDIADVRAFGPPAEIP